MTDNEEIELLRLATAGVEDSLMDDFTSAAALVGPAFDNLEAAFDLLRTAVGETFITAAALGEGDPEKVLAVVQGMDKHWRIAPGAARRIRSQIDELEGALDARYRGNEER